VDGTLIQGWAGHNSFRAKDGSDDDTGDFKGYSGTNNSHKSTTDADEPLYRKGCSASGLRVMGHTLIDNCHGMIVSVSAVLTTADGYTEREAARMMNADASQSADEKAQIILGTD
jgi:hypothetical protein